MSHLKTPRTIHVNSNKTLPVPHERGRRRAYTPQAVSRNSRSKSSARRKRKKTNGSKTPMIPSRKKSVPRKLGPRDIGRISYKGINYVEKNENHFLDEKPHRMARSSQVSKKRTKGNKGWKRGYVFLDDAYGPSNDKALKAIDWPSEFKVDHNNQYWFESTHVQMDNDLRKLIEVLPKEQKSRLHNMPLPKEHHSQIAFLKELRKMVMTEVKRLHIEDKELTKLADEIDEDYNRDLDKALDEVLAKVDDDENDDMDLLKKSESMHGNNKSTMTLDVDIDEAIDGIIDDKDVKETELIEHKYNKLLKRRNNKMGLFQRKLFNMNTINELTDLINNMEDMQEMKIQNK